MKRKYTWDEMVEEAGLSPHQLFKKEMARLQELVAKEYKPKEPCDDCQYLGSSAMKDCDHHEE